MPFLLTLIASIHSNFVVASIQDPPSKMKFFLKLLASASACALLASCGGSRGEDSGPTRRPKSLDGIVLTLSNNVTFEFVRNAGTPAAVANGSFETGTFFYRLGGAQVRQYPNVGGDNSDTRWPDSISGASYVYRAVNNESAVLTLNGVGVNDLVTTGNFNANNGSFTFLFNSDSGGTVSNQVDVDLTFRSTGLNVDTDVATVSIVGSAFLDTWDTIRVPAGVRLVSGAAVPENYDPVIDPFRPSRIVPESLTNSLYRFNHGGADPQFNFTLQFTRDLVGVGGSTTTETGSALQRVAGSVTDVGVNYTWTRIGGTDTGRLVISGGNNTFDGGYILSFAGPDSGAYVGQADDLTPDPAEVTGTFTVTRN
jgi:hypothetical protein